MTSSGVSAHVRADLSNDFLDHPTAHSRDAVQSLDGLLEVGQLPGDLLVYLRDLPVQEVDVS
jgi:hypothetical protein